MSTRRDLLTALNALEHGWLPVEEVLRAALLRGERPDLWERLKLSPRNRPTRRPFFRRHKRYPRPVAEKTLGLARKRYGGYPGVLSIHWGLRRHAGVITSEPCVVVFVETKRKLPELQSAHRIPAAIRLRHNQRSYSLPIDVQGVGRAGRLHATDQASPGNRALVSQADLVATLGAITTGSDGSAYAIVSGHLALNVGNHVDATPYIGTPFPLGNVAKIVFGTAGDAASVGPLPPDLDTSSLVSGAVQVRDPQIGDESQTVTVFTRDNPEGKTTFIDCIDATFKADNITVDGLAATHDQVSQDGDSGSPAIDSLGFLVGFVVGAFANRTYLMPAGRALDDVL